MQWKAPWLFEDCADEIPRVAYRMVAKAKCFLEHPSPAVVVKTLEDHVEA